MIGVADSITLGKACVLPLAVRWDKLCLDLSDTNLAGRVRAAALAVISAYR